MATANRNTDSTDLLAAAAAGRRPRGGRHRRRRARSRPSPATPRRASPATTTSRSRCWPPTTRSSALQDATLDSWANGYADERAVFDAVAADPSLALVDFSVMPGGFNDYDFQAKDVTVENDRFEPFQLQFLDTDHGRRAHGHRHRRAGVQIGPAVHGRHLRQRGGLPRRLRRAPLPAQLREAERRRQGQGRRPADRSRAGHPGRAGRIDQDAAGRIRSQRTTPSSACSRASWRWACSRVSRRWASSPSAR